MPTMRVLRIFMKLSAPFWSPEDTIWAFSRSGKKWPQPSRLLPCRTIRHSSRVLSLNPSSLPKQVPLHASSGQFMPNPLRERPSAAKSASSVRLDSWKEIATFLGKAERTVKRWERDRDLPVHRVPGGGHASVYAYAAELTAWLESTGGREAAADVAAAKNAKIPEELKNEDSSQSCSDNRGILPVSTAKTPLGTLKRLVVYGSLVMLALGLVFYIAALRGPNRGRIGGLISRFRPAPAFEATVAARVPQAEKNLSHDFYLKGRYEWEQRTPDSLNRALDNFTQALIHDPGNAHAYVGMADTYLLLREYTTMPEDEAYLRAISAA